MISTHFLVDVQRMSTDVVVLAEGRVALAGLTEHIAQDVRAPRRVRLEVVNDPELARMALGSLVDVRDIETDGQVLSFTFEGSRYDLPAVLERLISQQIKVVTFAEERGELETILGRAIAIGRTSESVA